MANNENYTGGPAYPVPDKLHTNSQVVEYGASGMTLRDHFAAVAMQGYLATYGDHPHPAHSGKCDVVAHDAYTIADAMLKVRSYPTRAGSN